jgi:hypothetical protein
VTLRFAYSDDAVALRLLADLDSRRLPGFPLLVAEVDGRILAAIEIGGVGVIADPFEYTTDLVSLLRDRQLQLHNVPLDPDLVDRLLTPEAREPAWFRRPPRRR